MNQENVITAKEAKELAEELANLCRQQYEALQQVAYSRMSPENAAEYDQRRLRIGELCGLLVSFKPK